MATAWSTAIPGDEAAVTADLPNTHRDARTSYQPLAWLERFGDDECTRQAARMALDEIDRYRSGPRPPAAVTTKAREN